MFTFLLSIYLNKFDFISIYYLSRNARHQLERDLANKDHSIGIDHTCHNLQNTSRAINLHGGIEKVKENIARKIDVLLHTKSLQKVLGN